MEHITLYQFGADVNSAMEPLKKSISDFFLEHYGLQMYACNREERALNIVFSTGQKQSLILKTTKQRDMTHLIEVELHLVRAKK